MAHYEYKVVPAPEKGVKAKGVKRSEDRLALALSQVMNALGADGWDYVRADILPTETRSGLTSKQTVYHTLLVFRRERQEAADMPAPEPDVQSAETALPPVEPDVSEAPLDDAQDVQTPEEEAPDLPRRDVAAQ
ncbi:DUF4177 domain-containing protein [Nioella nitratireducens]|uniref:DUF4177 domain-containing protein n=1 Tax=Nioella nitratireducens TaxID=1287720 RepID=UPI0008FCECB7|nr:DUF4177 domain-containing protein [Nioella nitratireducens]